MDGGSGEKKLVRVTIFQQPYTLRSSGEQGETEELAAAVDGLMNQIAGRTGAQDSTRVAVLACLHLADRLRGMERETESLRQSVQDAAGKLDQLLAETAEPPGA
jgi:cell division protein ZapA